MSLELEFICGRRPGNLLANIRPNGGLAKLDDDLALGRVEVLSKIPLIGVFTSTSQPLNFSPFLNDDAHSPS